MPKHGSVEVLKSKRSGLVRLRIWNDDTNKLAASIDLDPEVARKIATNLTITSIQVEESVE